MDSETWAAYTFLNLPMSCFSRKESIKRILANMVIISIHIEITNT